MLTVPKAMATIIMISVKDGFRFTLLAKEVTFSFSASIAELSALNHLSMALDLPIPIKIIAIQILATTISTKTILPYSDWLYSKISSIAVWLAPPPIQLPARVERPLQTASGPTPPTVSGDTMEINKIAMGPPITIPKVPVRNMTKAFQPKLNTAFKSMLKVISTNAAGNKYLLET